MIFYSKKTVFGTDADFIVNTVNCVGVMGKGLALEFSLRYPELNDQYIRQCEEKKIKTGSVYFYRIGQKNIINFPTKFHFKYPSKIDWIESGLNDFIRTYKSHNVQSVAFPLLGASLGGLNKEEVCKLMESKLKDLDIKIYICSSEEPDEKESEMIEAYNDFITKKSLFEELNIKNKKIVLFKVKRFHEISKFQGMTPNIYSKIHNYFYKEDFKNPSLFGVF